MNIQQAIRRYRIRQGVGFSLMVFGALFYFVSLLISLHRQAEKLAESEIFGHLGGLMQNLVADIYQITSPFIGFVWNNAPTLNQEKPLSYGNLLFLGLLGVMIVGKQLLLSARHLRGRVQAQLERLEEAQWRNSMQNGAATQVNANQIGHINFYQQSMPQSSNGDWWQRPWGIVGLSIIGGYIVAVLAKFTGMV
ncbi:YniB family protein [Pseudomonas reactans]|uniref:YniB-like protein n=3 Tax=Pseudomonas TaxID=286 RepID=A0A7Y8D5E1_9PSED|nr:MULTISPECIES: YniB family protein [Pseudomonas]NWA45709.1 hypothetical protein [Pseudomonas reactans]NWB30160.1 hypothetical protein [Pseudomonas gingeri]NWC50503.1 hypothetical protein [Pseudomonas tolaasii]NWC77371.1 hypothetical protein [Pseudomonas sp. P7759]NWE04502.1 hypothetical protein [Pseudomonas sp. IPO3749]NWE21058.1 hypothetical protein [Pseudomonas sp. P7548]